MPCKDPRDDYRPHLPWEVLLVEDHVLSDRLLEKQDFREAAKLVLAAFGSQGDAVAFARLVSPPALVRLCPC